MALVYVLVHSPLVGPTTWRWVADEMRHRGHEVRVPSLVGVADAPRPRWRYCVDAAASVIEAGDQVVLVGHSGAGPLLPAISSASRGAVSHCIFVDAGLPAPPGASQAVDAEFRATLDSLANRGRLPPWSEWFGPKAMPWMVPDPARRAAVESDLPCVPLDYFDDPIETPADWADPSSYLLLSALYEDDANAAEARGWPVLRLAGSHLHMVVEPAVVADALALTG